MRRRALLAALAGGTVGLAGCNLPGSGTTDTVTPAPVPTESGTPTADSTDSPDGDPARPEGFASVIDLATLDRTYAFRPTSFRTDDEANVALWFDRTETAEHPARLRGWLENANSFENTFQIEWIPAVGRVHARQPSGYNHEASLHLAPTENNEIADEAPELTQTEDGHWIVRDVGPWMPETHRLEPGERVTLEYALAGERDTPGRPTGTYEFRGRDQTVSVAVWDSTSPGPEGSSRFSGESVPDVREESTIQWYHEADAETPVFVRPSVERAELDAAIDLELVHHGRESVGCGHWNLHKFVDGEWFHVGPRLHTSDCRNLAPGERIQWTLRAFNGEAVPCGDGCGGGAGSCSGGLTQGYLGGGTYAVVAGYGHPADESGALVELVGDPVEIVPPDGVTTERDGDTVVVTMESYGDGEHPPDESFSITRTDAAEERLLAEQVMTRGGFGTNGNGLRAALAALEADVERVVVRADEHVVGNVLGHDQETRRFSLRGQAYELTRDGGEE